MVVVDFWRCRDRLGEGGGGFTFGSGAGTDTVVVAVATGVGIVPVFGLGFAGALASMGAAGFDAMCCGNGCDVASGMVEVDGSVL